MARNGKRGLNPRQKRFVRAMLTCPTIRAAAKEAGIGERTAHRYLAQPQVRRALSAALDAALSQATTRTVAAMSAALATLEKVHQNTKAPASARVSAARAILEGGPKLREALDLAERVALLEEQLSSEV